MRIAIIGAAGLSEATAAYLTTRTGGAVNFDSILKPVYAHRCICTFIVPMPQCIADAPLRGDHGLVGLQGLARPRREVARLADL